METRRSPHGERGLKLRGYHKMDNPITSLPSRGAWIEILNLYCPQNSKNVAPLTGSVD